MEFRFYFMLLALVGLVACSQAPSEAPAAAQGVPSSTEAQPVSGDWIVSAMLDDPDTLNPVTVQTENGQEVVNLMFDGLITQDNDTLKFKPSLAEAWEISPDKLVFTFHLRHDVKWHDGVPFTADDVKYTYDRIQDPKVDAADSRSTLTSIKSCDVLDPYTVRFTADHPYFQTFSALGFPIVPKHILTEGEPDFNRHPFGRHPIGTGSYRFVSWTTGSRIVLERTPDDWHEKKPYPDRLVYQLINDQSVSLQLLKKGDIDLMDGIPSIKWQRQLAHNSAMRRLDHKVYDFPAYNYLGFNLRRPVFQDVRVRHAIDLLIPRQSILQKVYLNTYATPCSGYEAIGSPSYNHDVPPTPNDPQLARELLREAGWTLSAQDGRLHNAAGQTLAFTALYNVGNEERQKILELTQEALQQEGIAMQIQKMDFPQMIARIEDWNFDAAMGAWTLPLESDPYQLWHSSQADLKKSSNFLGYKNPAVDKLIEAGRAEYDDDKRNAMFREVHRLVHDDYPCCFLFDPREILVYSNRFQNVRTFAPRPCFDLTDWYVPRARQKYTETPQ